MKNVNNSSYWRQAATVSVMAGVIIGLGWAPAAKADPIPSNRVQIRMDGLSLSGAYSEVAGQPTGVGQFKNGNVGDYPEGSCVPIVLRVTNNDDVAGEIELTPYFDHSSGGSKGILSFELITTGLSNPYGDADDLNDFGFTGSDFSAASSFSADDGSSVGASVSGPYAGQAGSDAPAAGDAVRHYNVMLQSVPSKTTVYVLFCARLDLDASQYGGGSQLSVRTVEGGAENVPIQVSKLLVLPKLTLTKVVEGGTATADEWSFHVSPAINGVSDFPIADGLDTVVIDNIEPDGVYSITEFGPAGYQFKSGSGENCVFDGSTASTTLYAAKPQVTATCVFTNEYVTPVVLPKLTVTKVVVNDDGGAAVVADFTLFVGGMSVTSSEENVFATGTYAVTETGTSGYAATFSGDCDSTGQVTLAEGDIKSCTITNDDVDSSGGFVATTGTLVVFKLIDSAYGGELLPGDFTLAVSGTTPTPATFAGSSSGTAVVLGAGAYSVSETNAGDYVPSYGEGCAGTIAAGQTVNCIVTNRFSPNTTTTADLSIVKTANASSIQTGTILDYLITLTNIGPDPATNAVVTDILPAGFIYQSSVASQGSYDSSSGAWTIGAMAVNATATLSIRVAVTAAAGLYVNTATATALEYDPVHENNVASASVTVQSANNGGGGNTGGGGGSTGGGTPTYIYTSTGGGGLSSTSGGGATGFAPPAPIPQVLGVTDEAVVVEPAPAAPEPKVLGATDELPRTGAEPWFILVALGVAMGLVRRKIQ
jgi:uncharacterized repeat protein (TIGR01451 family)